MNEGRRRFIKGVAAVAVVPLAGSVPVAASGARLAEGGIGFYSNVRFIETHDLRALHAKSLADWFGRVVDDAMFRSLTGEEVCDGRDGDEVSGVRSDGDGCRVGEREASEAGLSGSHEV